MIYTSRNKIRVIKMNIIVILVAIVFLSVGVLFNQKSRLSKDDNVNQIASQETPSVMSATDEPRNSPTEKPIIKSQTTPLATTTPDSQNNILEYRYNQAEIIEVLPNSLIIKSTDDTKTITNWYKEKIKSEGMNINTFVETNTNNNILNKLVGATGQKELRIEITKKGSDLSSQINISLKYF